MKCPKCGAENDPANQFCDQCGTRLDAAPAATSVAEAASQPGATALVCPSCGSPALPGEAFCDECGAPLNLAPPAVTSNDAPTVLAPPPAATSSGTVCAACGYSNVPGDNFCDNCGAALGSTTPEAVPTPELGPVSEEPTVVSGNGASPDVQAEPAVAAPEPSPAGEPVAEAAPTDQPLPVPPEAPAPIPPEPTPAPAIDAQAVYAARRGELEAEIARQQQIIGQFEQMQTTFGAAAPPAVAQGLAEAREGLTRAQSELDALQPPSPTVDPAEVARLESEIARQQQIIGQFEQMQAMFGSATPPAVAQGLAEAREELDRVQNALAALTGVPAPVPEAVSVPEGAEVPAVPAPEPAPAPLPGTAPLESAVAPPPPPSGPRLVLPDGNTLALPPDKVDITIGREDPISGIHPEVDLTAHGGELGGVSRQHARLHQAGGQWTITDLNSTNQTRVNGTQIEPGVAVPIQDGVLLQFGKVTATFHA